MEEDGGTNLFSFVRNIPSMNYDFLGLEILTQAVNFPNGEWVTDVLVDRKVYGYITGGQSYLVPSKYSKNGNMIVVDYHVTVFGLGNHRMLSEIILNGTGRWIGIDEKERIKQVASLILSFATPLKLVEKVPEGLTAAMEVTDYVSSGYSAYKAYGDEKGLAKAIWEGIGVLPWVGIAKNAADILTYESKSLEPFDRVEKNGFKNIDEPIDLTCQIDRKGKITDKKISEAIVKYHSAIK